MAAFVRDCNDCNKAKIGVHLRPPPVRYLLSLRQFEVVHVDLARPLPANGNFCYLLILVDRSSWWIEFEPLVDISTPTIAKAFIQV